MIRRGAVDIWYRSTAAVTASDLHLLRALISDDERTRADRFVFDRDRRDFIVAHALLRTALSHRVPMSPGAWRFSVDEHGKPSIARVLEGADLAFSLSHTRGLVACAVTTDGAVGVDVEAVSTASRPGAFTGRDFAPSEVAILAGADPSEYAVRFIELWTLKESYLKAVGLGLAHSLSSFSFGFDGASHLTFGAPPAVDAGRWSFLLAAPADGYRLALAFEACGYALNAVEICGDNARTRTNVLRTSHEVTIRESHDLF